MNLENIINVRSLKEQVYDYLRHLMSVGELRPGSVINLDATSRKLGISKTPLREALIILELEDFVTILPRRGVYVNELSLKQIRDYYELIGSLESTALLTSARLFPGDFARRMAEANASMKTALDRDNFDDYYRYNLEFHDVYLAQCGNEKLIKSVGTMKKRLYDFPRREGYVKEWEMASIAEHRQIYEYVADGRFHEAAHYIQDVHWSFPVQEPFIVKYYHYIDGK